MTNIRSKPVYRAAFELVVVGGSAAPFVELCGGVKKARLLRARVSGGTLTAIAYNSIQVAKYTVAGTAGTATNPTGVPQETGSPSVTATVKAYTAAPTPGSLAGVVASKRILLQATTAAAAALPDQAEFDFTQRGDSEGVCAGPGESVALKFANNPATAVTVSVEIEWTEE